MLRLKAKPAADSASVIPVAISSGRPHPDGPNPMSDSASGKAA